jgi:hypothetical protein
MIGVLEFDSRRRLGIFLLTTASRTALGPTQPFIQWVTGTLSLGVERPGREADHSPLSSAEVKEPLPQYIMAWCSVNCIIHLDKIMTQEIVTLYFYVTDPLFCARDKTIHKFRDSIRIKPFRLRPKQFLRLFLPYRCADSSVVPDTLTNLLLNLKACCSLWSHT